MFIQKPILCPIRLHPANSQTDSELYAFVYGIGFLFFVVV